jgi:SAM-dependent methyltransferase
VDSGKTCRAVGLDTSDEMLRVARSDLRERREVRLVLADYRDFSLDERFDAVFCMFDTLNYLHNDSELDLVLACVRNHLRMPGFFVFDVITESQCLWTDGHCQEFETDGARWRMRNAYERVTRKLTTYLEFEEGVEAHEQIPLGRGVVTAAAMRAGLHVSGVFADQALTAPAEDSKRLYFVLCLPSG